MEYSIEKGVDRELNDTWEVIVSKDGDEVESQTFYSREAAKTWVELHYPEAEEA